VKYTGGEGRLEVQIQSFFEAEVVGFIPRPLYPLRIVPDNHWINVGWFPGSVWTVRRSDESLVPAWNRTKFPRMSSQYPIQCIGLDRRNIFLKNS